MVDAQHVVSSEFMDIEPPFMYVTDWLSMGEMIAFWVALAAVFVVFIWLSNLFLPSLVVCRKVKKWQKQVNYLSKDELHKFSLMVYLEIKQWSIDEADLRVWDKLSFSNEQILLEELHQELDSLLSNCKFRFYWNL